MVESAAQALRALADAHLSAVLQRLPSDRMGRFIVFIEGVRAIDYWSITANAVLLRHGMDPATEEGMQLHGALWDQAWNPAKSRDFRVDG